MGDLQPGDALAIRTGGFFGQVIRAGQWWATRNDPHRDDTGQHVTAVGDVVLIHTRSRIFGRVVMAAQWAMHLRGWRWDHAAWVNRIDRDGVVFILEASTRGGVRETKLSSYGQYLIIPQHLSADRLVAAQAAAATWLGTPYGWVDDVADVCLILNLRPKWVERQLRSARTVNCSQLVAFILWAADVRKWGAPTWVVPADLYN
jgi:hypothetical protein